MKDLKKYAFANTTIKVEEAKVDEAKVNEQNATQDDTQHVDEAKGTDWSDAPKNVDDKRLLVLTANQLLIIQEKSKHKKVLKPKTVRVTGKYVSQNLKRLLKEKLVQRI